MRWMSAVVRKVDMMSEIGKKKTKSKPTKYDEEGDAGA